ncbi:MAG: hypothetical protein JSW23_00340 [Planctomycetota bacterium]|nr:MAG: hypothetical protein JSW23_00340 [Planctomycetota bacterium]
MTNKTDSSCGGAELTGGGQVGTAAGFRRSCLLRDRGDYGISLGWLWVCRGDIIWRQGMGGRL